MKKNISQDVIIAQARTWLGVPFQHQGRSKQTGVDCAGFITELLKELHLLKQIEEPPNYRRQPDGRLEKLLDANFARIDKAVKGSLVLLKWPLQKHASHIAICTGPTLIHAYQRVGAVIESSYRGFWLRDTHAVYLFTGVTYV